MTPSLTLNAGLRWDVQTPFAPVNDTMSAASLADVCGTSGLGDGSIYSACNFYAPGSSGGKVPEFAQFTSGTRGYNTDWNNVAPNLGLAWRPNVQSGWLRSILGDPEQATIRGGYSVAYERQGFAVFTSVWGNNPGSTLSLTRNANTGLVPPGESWPVLLRETNRLYPAPFPESPTFPIPIRPNRADNVNAFHPDVQVASARSWTVGLQRAIGRDMAVEARYVGTRGVNQWSELNYNERNLIENRFIDEFRLAMGNLQANNNSGVASRVGSFAYFGPGSSTSPLPIYLAYLNGRRDADNAAAYTTTAWTNTAITADLVRTNPQPGNSAADLDGDLARRNSAIAAGLPANFFVVNPHAGNVDDHRQRRLQRLSRAAARAAPPIVKGPGLQRELSVRARRNVGIPRFPLRARTESVRERQARDQESVELGPAGRTRSALRGGHAPGAQRLRRRLGVQRRCACPGADDGLRQRASRRHEREGHSGDVQVRRAHQSCERTGNALHDAGRCDSQHPSRVQHEPDVGERVFGSRRSGRTLLRAGEQRRLHSAQSRRLRTAHAG